MNITSQHNMARHEASRDTTTSSPHSKILSGLNPKQVEAVTTVDGPLLVVAGAGSGKTSVLTRRIAYLMAEKNVPPWGILAITFTNKAAKEMRERLDKLAGPSAADIWATTFHSMCVRILRREIEALGYARGFTILDDSDQLAVVKRILKDMNVDVKRFEPRAVLSEISNAKNLLISADKYRDRAGNPFERVAGDAYVEYAKRLKANQSLDFDDLIFKTVQLFKEHPDVLSFYHSRFHYIHVDEYQDTNHAQYELVRLLAQKRRNLCVVGDSDQAIYGWRGADIRNILEFERDYPEARVVRLEQNYRSTQNILEIANRVIENNRNRPKKNLWTDQESGDSASLFVAVDERDEARFIADTIESVKSPLREYAVLYRTNAQSRVLEEVLLSRGIAYRIFGGVKFYERKEIKDLLAYLRLISNPDDNLSFERAIGSPKRGVGETSLEKLRAFASHQGASLFGATKLPEAAFATGRATKAVLQFVKIIEDHHRMREFVSVTELTESLLSRVGLREALQAEKSLEAEARVENINEFLTVTGEFDARWRKTDDIPDDVGALEAFLEEVALLADTDLSGGKPAMAQPVATADDDRVVLMTLHSAKGLEFPTVFLVGMEEGLFPNKRALDSEADMEEERRLCYVGITRAKRKLYLTTSTARTIFGEFRRATPSRFLAEMPVHLVEKLNPNRRESWGWSSQATTGSTGGRSDGGTSLSSSGTSLHGVQMKVPASFGADLSVSYEAGDQVEHRKWGTGVILQTSGDKDDLELTIEFAQPIGRKTLLARFAPIRKR